MAASVPLRVLFDATRLLTRRGAAPTGIDRVDLAYFDALVRAPGVELQPIRFDALGPVRVSPHAVERLAANWRPKVPASPALDAPLRDWLEASAGAIAPAPAVPAVGGHGARAARALRDAFERPLNALRLGTLLAQRGVAPWVYLNTSHGRSYRPVVARWLSRGGVRSVFFLHDLIPIEHPEFNRPQEPRRHAQRLRTVAAHASRVIVNSAATRDALVRYLSAQQLPRPAMDVLPLGVAPPPADVRAPLRPARPYFVALSTIEPRKNHRLLLDLWRQLLQRHGGAAPRLVLVGARGWENEVVFGELDRLHGVSQHVAECRGLGDAALATVLRGARALLSPSLAEGYGLPVAEALALGTPVIASALPAHREVAASCAELLDPRDGAAWLRAIEEYSAEPSPRRERQRQNAACYRAPAWEAHFARALQVLREVALADAPVALAGAAPHA